MKTRVLPDAAPVVRLRPKNQITLPEVALSEVGANVGDRFLVSVDGDAVRLEPVRRTYAGTMKDAWPANWQEELRRERDAWQP